MGATFTLRGTLKGHSGAITCLATNSESPNVLISGSRDKTIISWNLNDNNPEEAGQPQRSLQGHSHFVEDIVLSSDGAFVLSCSWDRTLRLWNLATGQTTNTFVGHEKDVLSCAFSADNRQIISGSRDRSLKLWNILGECKATIGSDKSSAHTEWVSCVRFSPNPANPLIVSCGWDKAVKVWDLKGFGNSLKYNLHGHTGYVNTVAVSPDGSICASGGKDGMQCCGISMKVLICTCCLLVVSSMLWNLVQANIGFVLQLIILSESGILKPEPLSVIFLTSKLKLLSVRESHHVLLLLGVLMVALCMLVMPITSSESGKPANKQNKFL